MEIGVVSEESEEKITMGGRPAGHVRSAQVPKTDTNFKSVTSAASCLINSSIIVSMSPNGELLID